MPKEKNKRSASYSVMRIGIHCICIVFFGLNSFAVFRDYLTNPTIISTKISKAFGGLLDFPTILICEESTDKNTTAEDDFSGNISSNSKLDDLVIDMLVLKNAEHNLLEAKSYSIKENFQKLLTAFHGTCFINRRKFKVGKL